MSGALPPPNPLGPPLAMPGVLGPPPPGMPGFVPPPGFPALPPGLPPPPGGSVLALLASSTRAHSSSTVCRSRLRASLCRCLLGAFIA
jgi:hypothetical protein